MKDLIAWIVYIPLQIVFLPLAILGIGVSLYMQFVVSKKLGLSGTAMEVASERLILDLFGLRRDPVIRRVLQALPNQSTFAGWLILLPWYIRYRISGTRAGFPALSAPGRETVANTIADRTVVFDRMIRETSGVVSQFVLLGAGFDTRSYEPYRIGGLQYYELDLAATQRCKRAALNRAGVDSTHVRFSEVDFSTGSWTVDLKKAGFDAANPALFLWEGVTLYLTEAEVRKTLREIRSIAAPGSVLLCDFHARRFVTGEHSIHGRAAAGAASMSGESMRFGLEFGQGGEGALADFLAGEGLTAKEAVFLGAGTVHGAYMAVAEIPF